MSNVKSNAYMKQMYAQTVSMGDKAISSDAFFEIQGEEPLGMLIKQFPWPTTTVAGEIAIPTPNGGEMWQPQNLKVNMQGAVTFMETESGHVQAFFERIISVGGRFNAKVYEGTPEDFTRFVSIRNCFVQVDPTDRDWENRAQILQITGTLFFHYFGNQ